jgi:hypothetical protein
MPDGYQQPPGLIVAGGPLGTLSALSRDLNQIHINPMRNVRRMWCEHADSDLRIGEHLGMAVSLMARGLFRSERPY